MVPPPERSARRIVRTASAETEWTMETRAINPSSFNGMIAVLSYPAAIREPNVYSLQNGRIDMAFLGATVPQRNPAKVAGYFYNATTKWRPLASAKKTPPRLQIGFT